MTNAEFLKWFAQWKDVVTTAVAVAAIIVVVLQIRQAGRFERHRLRRERLAARATLPLTLAALNEYGRGMMQALAPIEAWFEQDGHDEIPTFKGPEVRSQTIAAAEKAIAAYPEDNVAKSMAAILGSIQILQSRSQSFYDPHELRTWKMAMSDNILMAASIIACCENLFPFAREGSDFARPSRSHIAQVLSRERIHQAQYLGVWKQIVQFSEEEPDINKSSWRRFLKKF